MNTRKLSFSQELYAITQVCVEPMWPAWYCGIGIKYLDRRPSKIYHFLQRIIGLRDYFLTC